MNLGYRIVFGLSFFLIASIHVRAESSFEAEIRQASRHYSQQFPDLKGVLELCGRTIQKLQSDIQNLKGEMATEPTPVYTKKINKIGVAILEEDHLRTHLNRIERNLRCGSEILSKETSLELSATQVRRLLDLLYQHSSMTALADIFDQTSGPAALTPLGKDIQKRARAGYPQIQNPEERAQFLENLKASIPYFISDAQKECQAGAQADVGFESKESKTLNDSMSGQHPKIGTLIVNKDLNF